MSKKPRQQYSKILKKETEKERREEEAVGRSGTSMFKGRNIHYEVAEKSQAINCGGIGVIHQMVRGVGW